MDTVKKKVWKVPLFCVVAGWVAFRVVIFLTSRFAIVTLANGSVSANNSRVLIIYTATFFAALLIGGLIVFRNMTKKELFLSASIIVVFQVAMIFIQWAFRLTTGWAAIFFLYIYQISEWSTIVPQLLYRLNDNIWIGAVVNAFVPYIFILFGKKTA